MPSLNTGNAILSNAITVGSTYNVGIGTSSPAEKLSVYLASSKSVYARLGANNLPSIGFLNDNATSYVAGEINASTLSINCNVGIGTSSPQTTLEVLGPNVAEYLRVGGGTISERSLRFSSFDVSGLSGVGHRINAPHSSGTIAFDTNSTERMRITSSGNALIGTTTDNGSKLQVNGLISANDGIISRTSNASLGTTNREGSNIYYWIAYNAGLRLYNDAVGFIGTFAPTTGVYTPLSDINKKKDFEESTIGLDAILGLKPTLFRMKGEDENTPKTLGFIAQEVKEFIPQAYMEDGEGEDKFIGLTDRPIIAVLVKAIQELNQTIQNQQEQINQLINK